MQTFLQRPQAVAISVVFLAAVTVCPVFAADDLAIVDDIPMPQIRIPEVNVDVRIGNDLASRAAAPRIYPRGPYAAMSPARYVRDLPDRPAVPPPQIAHMLRSTGYALLGPVNRRGWVYTVAVLDRNGDDGRAVIDARTGAIIRFVPAPNVDARFNDELETAYGPPGLPQSPPPIAVASYDNRRGALMDLKRTPRPAVAVPRVTQTPKVASKATAATARIPAAVANSNASVPIAAVPASPAVELKFWPTQAMPDMQSLE